MSAASYLDTSLLVALLTAEPHTEDAQRHLARSESVKTAISDWSFTEVSAALSIKIRLGKLSPQARADALGGLRRLVADSLDCLPVTGEDFRAAASLADQAEAGLRAGDALHLAVASRAGFTVHTFDRAMAKAADDLGLSCRLASTR